MPSTSRDISLRAVTPMDSNFLFKLYTSTRAEEMRQTGWDAPQQEIFLTSQYRARQESYRRQFPTAEASVIVQRGIPIGALIVDRQPAALTLVDLALMPSNRGQGVGRRVAEDLITQAKLNHQIIKAHALHHSRALRFWLRLGFTQIPGGTEFYTAIEWRPPAPPKP